MQCSETAVCVGATCCVWHIWRCCQCETLPSLLICCWSVQLTFVCSCTLLSCSSLHCDWCCVVRLYFHFENSHCTVTGAMLSGCISALKTVSVLTLDTLQQGLLKAMSYCSVCLCLDSCSCDDKFVQEHGVLRLWEVVRFNFLLPHNQVLANECWGGQWCRSKILAKSSLHR